MLAQATAIIIVFDFSRDAHASERRHQHEVSSGNADVSREGGPLGANAFFDDLDQHLVAPFEDFLDGRLDPWPITGRDRRPSTAFAAAIRSFLSLSPFLSAFQSRISSGS